MSHLRQRTKDQRQMNNPLIKSATGGKGTEAYGMTTGEKLEKIQNEVNQIGVIMHKNIDLAIQRKENLDDLNEKTEDLERSAARFADRSRKLRLKICIQNYKKNIIIFLFVLAIIIFIVCSIYFGSK